MGPKKKHIGLYELSVYLSFLLRDVTSSFFQYLNLYHSRFFFNVMIEIIMSVFSTSQQIAKCKETLTTSFALWK